VGGLIKGEEAGEVMGMSIGLRAGGGERRRGVEKGCLFGSERKWEQEREKVGPRGAVRMHAQSDLLRG